MRKMGFDEAWTNWVSLYGMEVGSILPKWGLHQGDPISPYLFILCTKRLSFFLAEMQGVIYEVSICR
ncbi:reverse transcriptase [Gossypium australe]|uniref:Reverse transcriptase n=1 Tax=Gossypium australe TaxID=47621 RepID=A0A5B6TLS6_9ROSI|nr:reverse transcriptase [Gossypium australe]